MTLQTKTQLDDLTKKTGETVHSFEYGYYEFIDGDWCYFNWQTPFIIKG